MPNRAQRRTKNKRRMGSTPPGMPPLLPCAGTTAVGTSLYLSFNATALVVPEGKIPPIAAVCAGGLQLPVGVNVAEGEPPELELIYPTNVQVPGQAFVPSWMTELRGSKGEWIAPGELAIS